MSEIHERRAELHSEWNTLREREQEIEIELSHIDAQLFNDARAEDNTYELVKDWSTLRPGETAAVVIDRSKRKNEESWAGDFTQYKNVYGTVGSACISIHCGGSSFTPIYADGSLQKPVKNITVNIWRYIGKVPEHV